MITVFGVSLGALSPWFLAAIPITLATLVYIFRAKGIAHPRVISSLFLLSKLPEFLPSRKRFLPPLQFWLELLACILLALAASGVFSAQLGNRVAIVLDNSKSMSTLQSSGEARLQTALRIAEADISSSKSDTSFAVFSTLPSEGLPHSDSSSPGQKKQLFSGSTARQKLRSIEQSYGADSLQGTVTSLVTSKDYDAIWVYTDKELASPLINSPLKVITVPSDTSTLSNVWIESVTVREQAAAATESKLSNPYESPKTIEVSISATGSPSPTLSITATCTDLASGASFELGAAKLTVSPSTSTQSYLLPINRSWSYCRVQVKSADTANYRDALALDNEAWIAHSSAPRQIALYSSLTPREVGLSDLPYNIVEGRSAMKSSSIAGAFYHRSLPQQSSAQTTINLPSSPSLLVLPPGGARLWSNGLVAVHRTNALEVTRWDSSHPLLQYVQPALISIPTAAIITCPDTSKPVVFTSAGPVVCAGEEGGIRYIIVGFEILPFDGLRSATISIFTLNALRWLFGGPGESLESTATQRGTGEGLSGIGSLTVAPEIRSVSMVAPQKLSLVQTIPQRVVVPSPGIVALSNQDVDDVAVMLLAVNAFSREESDIVQPRTFTIAAADAISERPTPALSGEAAKLREKTFFETHIIWLLLATLLIDIIRRIATRSRWGGTT